MVDSFKNKLDAYLNFKRPKLPSTVEVIRGILCATITTHHHQLDREDQSGGFFLLDTTKCLFHGGWFTANFLI